MENVVLNVKSPTGETVRILYRRGDSAKSILRLAKRHFEIERERVVLVVADRPHEPLQTEYAIPVSDIHAEQDMEMLLVVPR